MRAKQVNEVQNFERGMNPKSAMGIGGLNIGNDYQERMDSYMQEIDGVTLSHTDEWRKFLEDTFVGKRITAELKKMPSIDSISGKSSGSYQKGKFTIEVKDILPSWGMGNDFSAHNSGSSLSAAAPPILIVADAENNMYQMAMDQKIYFG